MKTTLNISDLIMSQLKEQAAKQGKTMSELVEAALRRMFQKKETRSKLPRLPAFRGGGSKVNIANRDALYDRMES